MYLNKLYPFVDCHCDTLTEAKLNGEELYDNNRHNNIIKLLEFDAPVQVFSIWLSKENKGSYYKNTLDMIEYFYNQCDKYSDYIALTKSYNEILDNRKHHRISGILGIEGGEILEGNLSNLQNLYDLGIRIITITWNYSNEIAHGVNSISCEGLTKFGKKAISKMNELGIIIDVSHLNEKGFWDIYDINSKKHIPFVASHSNAFEICNSKRNLKDDQIKAIADVNGVIGINLYSDFVSVENPNVENLLKHIDYIINLVGENHLGLGCDFDGCDKLISGIQNVSSLSKLFDLLLYNYGENITNKILFENFMRVYSTILK